MKVFLTGATGYVGRSVADALLAAGHQVLALVRDVARAPELGPNFCVIQGDFRRIDAVASTIAAADGVIHAGAEHGPGMAALDRFVVNTALDALAGSSKAFLYTSGVWIYGDTGGRTLGEIGPLHPPERVAWRVEVEELVLNAKERGVHGMVVRPGMVFGRGGGFVGEMFASYRTHGEVRLVGDGANHWSNIHVDDLADLYARMIVKPAAGEAFLACGGVPQPVGKIALAVAKQLGNASIVHVPVEAARAELGSMADCLVMDQKLASTKAVRFYGWSVRRASIFDEIFTGSYAQQQ